jgi:hypothetical protein
VTFGSGVSQNAFGEHPFRANARYVRARLSGAANDSTEDIQGIDVMVADGGGR